MKEQINSTQVNSKAPEKYLEGIFCAVGNCAYNCQQRYCTASKIDIGPHFAITSGDTICSTFKPQ